MVDDDFRSFDDCLQVAVSQSDSDLQDRILRRIQARPATIGQSPADDTTLMPISRAYISQSTQTMGWRRRRCVVMPARTVAVLRRSNGI